MARLEIKADSVSPQRVKLLVDGREISGVRELSLHIEQGMANTATIRFYVDGIDVDAEVLAMLEAIVKK